MTGGGEALLQLDTTLPRHCKAGRRLQAAPEDGGVGVA